MGQNSNAVEKTDAQLFRPLRVLLDARKLGDGGIGVYIENMIKGLLWTKAVDLTLLVSPEASGQFDLPEGVSLLVDPSPKYSLDELFFLSRRIDFSAFDLFHVPHYTLPFGVSIPTVITIHDLIHLTHPEHFFYPLVARPYIRSALRRATRVITISRASYDDLRLLAAQEADLISKVSIVPNSVDEELFVRGLVETSGERWRKSSGNYFLAVFSNSKPHKGLDDLLTAYAELRNESASASEPFLTQRLVLVGPGTSHLLGKSLGGAMGGPDEVVVLGSVNRSELRRLYAYASALVVPSHAEGFSLPVLEAHAAGVPVIARPVPAVQELLTDYDVKCQDFSIASLKAGLRQFLKTEHGNKGVPELSKLSQGYRIEDAARAVLQVYTEAVHKEEGCLQ